MTRRSLIATLLAAILAPFRRAKAASFPWVLATRDDDGSPVTLFSTLHPAGRTDDLRALALRRLASQPGKDGVTMSFDFGLHRLGVMRGHVSPSTAAIFGLCPKCGGLQCRCD